KPRLIDGCGSETLGVAHDELLGAGRGGGGEASHTWAGIAGGNGILNVGTVKMVIPRPVSRLLVNKIHSFADFIVSRTIFLPVLTIINATCTTARSGRRNERQDIHGWRIPGRHGNHATGKNTGVRAGVAGAAYKAVRLIDESCTHGVTHSLVK